MGLAPLFCDATESWWMALVCLLSSGGQIRIGELTQYNNALVCLISSTFAVSLLTFLLAFGTTSERRQDVLMMQTSCDIYSSKRQVCLLLSVGCLFPMN